jgi:CubicO group peptidase (beta-lactamase class C family)
MRRLSILALALTTTLPGIGASQGSAGAADTTARVVDRLFDEWRGTDRPGCAVGVSRDGRVVYEQGYGMANLETGTPIRPWSIFQVGSTSKQFTAMAIMLLVGDGKLSLDDNIRRYLPEIPDYGTPITIRHLLTHTSGLRDYDFLFSLRQSQADLVTDTTILRILSRQRALNFTPGTQWSYSNSGFMLLGLIVARVSGHSLREFADERMFRPLGMANTHFHDQEGMLTPGRTTGYLRTQAGWRVFMANETTVGGTGLFTTVGDMLKWEANLDHPLVGDRALVDQMEAQARLTNGDTINYGFGLGIGRYRGARGVGHGGTTFGYQADERRFPEQGLAVAVECNTRNVDTQALVRRIADAYLGGALGPVETEVPPQPVPVAAAVLASRVGIYVQPTTLEFVDVSMRDGELTYNLNRRVDRPMVPVAEHRFRVTGEGEQYELVFADGERAGFERQTLRAGRPFGHPLPFEWRQPVLMRSSALAEYGGEYYSEELDTRWRVTASDSGLSLHRQWEDRSRSYRALFSDTFFGGGGLIQFTRSGRQVTGIEVTIPSVRRVRFARVPAGR